MGDGTDKKWDEERLRRWEWKRNGGRDWEGRPVEETLDQPANSSVEHGDDA